MTAEERVKVRDWARRNLGKEVTYLYERMVGLSERHEVMVVGYSELSAQVTGEEKEKKRRRKGERISKLYRLSRLGTGSTGWH